jgi:hypothetical protein
MDQPQIMVEWLALYRGVRLVVGASQRPVKKIEKYLVTFDECQKTVVYCKASLLTTIKAKAKTNRQRGVRKKSVQTLK